MESGNGARKGPSREKGCRDQQQVGVGERRKRGEETGSKQSPCPVRGLNRKHKPGRGGEDQTSERGAVFKCQGKKLRRERRKTWFATRHSVRRLTKSGLGKPENPRGGDNCRRKNRNN